MESERATFDLCATDRGMTNLSIQTIRSDLHRVEQINDLKGAEAFAKFYMDGPETVIQLNEVAAIQFCRHVLDCVSKDFSGSHQHLDDSNFIDEGDVRFRIERTD